MNFLKKLGFVVALGTIVLSNTACTKENADNKPATNVETKASMSNESIAQNNQAISSSVKVYSINSVEQAKANKIVDFTFNDNGKSVKLSELTKGKAVFLNFWGTWCPPCRKEIPDIIEISKDLKDKEFIVIGIALERDPSNALKTVEKFAQDKGIGYHLFIGNNDLVSAYGGINAVPTTYIIDKNGNIVETIVGMRDKAGFMTSIKKVL